MVEWKKLGEIGDVCMCKRIMKHQTFDKGDVPFFKIGTFGGNADAFINRDLFLEYKSRFSFPNKGDILLSASGTIGRTVVYNGEDAYFQDSNIVWISNDESQVTNAFLYYCYQIVDWKIDGGTIKRLYNYNLKNTIIPVPSLSEQTRIVGILDTFTASIENLKEQIAQRRKQYEYYRDQLLDLEGKEGVEMKTIQDICRKICSGGTPSTSHKEYYDGNIPWLRTQEVDWKNIYDTEMKISEEAISNSAAKLIPANCVIVAMYGATAAKCAINKIPLSTNQACCNLEVENDKALYKYVYHWFCKEYLNLKSMGEGSQNNINGQKIKNYPIPVPSLQEQSRIVSILDTFEASIQNLEAQLKLREKQYEYYRNKLLTFE